MGMFQPSILVYQPEANPIARLQICPLYIFGNNPPQMVFLVGSKYWKVSRVWRLDWGPNLQPWIGISHSFLGFFCSTPLRKRLETQFSENPEVHPLQTLLLAGCEKPIRLLRWRKTFWSFWGGGGGKLVLKFFFKDEKYHPIWVWIKLEITWNYPPPSNSHHQDYSIFSRESL